MDGCLAATVRLLSSQEQKAKLQRRLEQLGMQQMRLEHHIAEAAQVAGAAPSHHRDSPASSRRSGHTSSVTAVHHGQGGGLRGSGIAPMPRPEVIATLHPLM